MIKLKALLLLCFLISLGLSKKKTKYQRRKKKEKKRGKRERWQVIRVNKIIKEDSLALQIIPPDLFQEVDDFESGKPILTLATLKQLNVS